MAIINGIIRIATDIQENWKRDNNPVILLNGELSNATYDVMRPTGYTGIMNDIKIGDGNTQYNSLVSLNPVKSVRYSSLPQGKSQPVYAMIGNDIENNYATGDYSTAFGHSCKSTGQSSFTIGEGNTASGQYSAAIGGGLVSDKIGQVTVGLHNTNSYPQSHPNPKFVVGTGTSNSKRNGLVVATNDYTDCVFVNNLVVSESGTLDATTINGTYINATNLRTKGYYPNTTNNGIDLLGGYSSSGTNEVPKLAIRSIGTYPKTKYVVTSDDENSDINSVVTAAVSNWAHGNDRMTNPMTEDLDMGNYMIKNIRNLVFNNTSVIAINNLSINQNGIGKTYTKNGFSNTAKIIFNNERIIIDGNNHDPGDQEMRLANPLLANNFLFDEITLDDIQYDEYITKNISQAMINKLDVPAALENKALETLYIKNLYLCSGVDSEHSSISPSRNIVYYIYNQDTFDEFQHDYEGVPFNPENIPFPLFILSFSDSPAPKGFFMLTRTNSGNCDWKDTSGNSIFGNS